VNQLNCGAASYWSSIFLIRTDQNNTKSAKKGEQRKHSCFSNGNLVLHASKKKKNSKTVQYDRTTIVYFEERSERSETTLSMSKYVIVTGGNAGIGFETAKELCRQGYYVTITARSSEKGSEAVAEIKKDIPDAKIGYMVMELKDLNSVRSFANEYISSNLPLHILLNNAGIMNTPYEMTKDGFEAQFQVNHLGHFLLTHYLIPVIQKSRKGGRVINVSSRAHLRWSGPLNLEAVQTESERNYDGWKCYGRSKLANILTARKLAQNFPVASSGITFNALHPGLVDTKLLNVAPGLNSQAIPLSEGIKCSIFAATAPELEGVTGKYFHDCTIVEKNPNLMSEEAQSDQEAETLWEESLKFVGLTDGTYGVPEC
jgi:NAD(P)-dependent dehydrogenase (short-subunit alcohol dehydrogenase family)